MITEQEKQLMEYLTKKEKATLEEFMELRKNTFRRPVKDRPNGKANKIYS